MAIRRVALALVVLAVAAGAAAAMPPGWREAARSDRAREAVRAWLAREKVESLALDLVPVAMRFLREARSASVPEEARVWAELAAEAAPDDPRPRWALALQVGVPWPDRIRHAAGAAWAVILDPWVQGQGIARLALAAAGAGWAVLLAFAAWALVARGRLLAHDYADAFPWRFRTWTPVGFLVLLAGAAWSAGFGPAAVLGALTATLVPYLPRRGRLWGGLALAMGFGLPAILGLGAYRPAACQEAWVQYLVRNGAGPRALTEALGRIEADDSPRRLLALHVRARRAGAWAEAVRLGERALASGGDPGFWQLELGNLAFLRGDLEQAERRFRAAAQARPDDPLPWYNLHLVYLANLELTAADEALAQARSLGAEAVERFEAQGSAGQGKALPGSAPLPRSWVVSPLLRPGPPAAWAGATADLLFWPWRGIPVWPLGLVGLAIAV
ncbi:MAG: hypothetical protein GXP50_09355, partial [Deltaproteobacteria bacterium]|nr:hypothetical protein [Deltaproteobacteria bacterium]